ncbi:uncharacterized protein [Palaemon carinicauda]|uniref:uncharacterized protein n=1 Tax=Palaemon carinicauda TaxID=392227 RepID=UPI0035B5B3C7
MVSFHAFGTKEKIVCITVDHKQLNSQVSHPTYPSPMPHNALHNISPTVKYLTTADAFLAMDDIFVFDEGLPNNLQHMHHMLTKCCQYSITLNKVKITVADPEVNFCGNVLSSDGIAAGPDKVCPMRDFPTPSNVTDLRSCMCVVNELTNFTLNIAAAAQSLYPLMRAKHSFIWRLGNE